MKFFRFILAILPFYVFNMATARAADADYTGDNGGYLVYSVGTIAIGMNFSFPYHRVNLVDGTSVSDWNGKIKPKLNKLGWKLSIKNPDFKGRETGTVEIRKLPPGTYVIDNFNFHGQIPGIAYDWSSGTPFQYKFVISNGQATYIGSFMRAPSGGTSLQPQLGWAGFFVISNRSNRDLPIAQNRIAQWPEVSVQVTDVDAFGNPALRSHEPE